MRSHEIVFADGKKIKIDGNEPYQEDVLDSVISQTFDGKKTKNGVPIFATSSISFYVIKDKAKASAKGIDAKDLADQMASIIINGALETAEKSKQFPFLMVAAFNGGAHYQGLTILFKNNKHIDVTVINSINKLQNMSEKEVREQLLAELYILKDLGLIIDQFQYKEHFLQELSVDCGPCTIANIEYELNHPQEAVKPTRLSIEEGILLRANHTYQHQFKQRPPAIISIDGKKMESAQEKIKSPQQQSIFGATNDPAKPALSLVNEISKACQEIFGASKEQGDKLAEIALAKGKNPLTEHMRFLFAEWSNRNGDIDKVIADLSAKKAPSSKH